MVPLAFLLTKSNPSYMTYRNVCMYILFSLESFVLQDKHIQLFQLFFLDRASQLFPIISCLAESF